MMVGHPDSVHVVPLVDVARRPEPACQQQIPFRSTSLISAVRGPGPVHRSKSSWGIFAQPMQFLPIRLINTETSTVTIYLLWITQVGGRQCTI
jgi:hypothetical protein